MKIIAENPAFISPDAMKKENGFARIILILIIKNQVELEH